MPVQTGRMSRSRYVMSALRFGTSNPGDKRGLTERDSDAPVEPVVEPRAASIRLSGRYRSG